MPTPKLGETKSDFLKRCIPILIEEGKDVDQAAAICNSIYEDEKELLSYELTIDDISYDGVTAISIVEFPAIEENFLVFNKQKYNLVFAKANKEHRIITGPAIIPNKMIYRINPYSGEEYYVYFNEETVKNISENFLIQNKHSNVTLEHQVNINDVYLIESWIVEDPKNDKANSLGFDVNKGTWMISLKVNNDEIWNNVIKQGKVNGFSIEGYFTTKFDKYSKEEQKETNNSETPKTQEEVILDKIKQLLEELDNEEKKN